MPLRTGGAALERVAAVPLRRPQMIQAVERFAQQATEAQSASSFTGNASLAASIDGAAAEHAAAVSRYIDWEYREAIAAATRALRRLDEAFGAMGEPDRIH